MKVILILTLLGQSLALRPRGVRPEMAGFYDPEKEFRCLDGKLSIPFDHVNDDYCDCQDGSDEPGTSACPDGKFYCLNKGFRPNIIMSSRVDDGICDCCDGSDEPESSQCANTCLQLGEADRVEREKLTAIINQGLEIKKDMLTKAKTVRAENEAKLQEKKADLEKLEAEKSAKEQAKEEAEALEKAALDAIREEEDRLRAEKEENEKMDRDNEAKSYFAKLDSNNDGILAKEELTAEIAFDMDNDGLVSEQEAEFYLSGNQEYNVETFQSTGWLLMRQLFTQTKERRDQKLDDYDEDFEDNDGPVADDNVDYDIGDEMEAPTTEPIYDDEQADTINNNETVTPEEKYSPEVQAIIDTANVARDAYRDADNAYKDIEREIQDIEGILAKDFGPNDVFADLLNTCFEFNDLEYTYKMCAFDYCSQKPINGGSETRLGSWDNWSTQYSQMSYQKGVACWNGPSRSTTVDVECGATNELVGASEPNRCEYFFKFKSPAACEDYMISPHDHDEL